MVIQLNILKEIFEIFKENGSNIYFGEEVTQYEHACQAALLAKKSNATLTLQKAAFLHDIGHILPDKASNELNNIYGVIDHDKIGAQWLKNCGFCDVTIAVVENHVDAKRYLCYKNPFYFHSLSDASKATLQLQGGIMDTIEADQFESKAYFNEILAVRKWDDMAKDPEMIVPEMLSFMDDLFLDQNLD